MKKEEVMKKRFGALMLALVLAFSLAIPAGAAVVSDVDQNGPLRITRTVPVSKSGSLSKTVAGKKVTIGYTCSTKVYINDSDDTIRYFAPVNLEVTLPANITQYGKFQPGPTEYNYDGKGGAEQEGTLTLRSGGNDYPVKFTARASINSNGTVSFSVY